METNGAVCNAVSAKNVRGEAILTQIEQRAESGNQREDAFSAGILAERSRLSYALLPGALAGCLLAVATVVWFARDQPMMLIRVWELATAAAIVMLAVLLTYYRSFVLVIPEAHWILRYCVVAAINGVGWGALGPILLRASSLPTPWFPVLVATMCAGSAVALAPSLSLFFSFTVPLMIGGMFTLAYDPARGPDVVLLVAVVYALSVLVAWRISRGIGDASRVAVMKLREITDASNVHAALERSHSELIKELANSRKIHAELAANETHFRALVETSGDIVWAVDASGCYTYVNGAAIEAILGYRAEEIIGYPFAQFADRASAQAFDDEFFRLIESGGQLEVRGVFRHRTGRSVDLAIRAIALYDEQGQFIGASGTAVDVSEIKTAESMLRQALAEQHAILNSATVGIAIVENGTIIRANSEFEAMFRYPPDRAEGLSVCELQSIEDPAKWLAGVDATVARRDVYDRDITARRGDGSTFWCRLTVRMFDQVGTGDAKIWVVQDISDRKQKEQAIEHAALHDALTGLPNRALLSDRLQQAIGHAARGHAKFGVLFLDLDRFKMVNDTIGHDGGDELLRTVAQRLRNRVRAADTVARQGGDEFIIMLPDVHCVEDVERVAETLLGEIIKPITIFGNDYVVTGSIGISLYPDNGTDGQTLLRNADAAMYRAKELGKNTWRVFSEDLHLQASEDVRLEHLLRTAIELQQLTVFYQPRVDLATGHVCSVEALCRWQHAALGVVEPSRFIAIAERAGLIGRLGDWVLNRACRDFAHLRDLGFVDIGLSVNVSHSQLSEPKLVANVRKVLRDYNIEPNRLELELTETAIARNVDQAVKTMERLEATGIGVAIDDFGTGYSSLSQLKRFPIRTLKIDRSFIDGLPDEDHGVAIALAVIAMAKGLKMRVVAEGVETADQRDFLLKHGCDEAQGFLFSPAVSLTRLIEVLERDSPSDAGVAGDGYSRRVA